ncbi:uncharacterized protein LDX57_006684 [Aspergillus melleus]|uniref:uncharacterized protein n=1 Tax=Aspergillus melleus TaxID=138277 RepID=UPI001E8EB49F|nr:uncharacterized protein LDX57_006684 [Aspergillus melleus]KAH8429013.1 hypothetical protein LDX57_006684 [Aspergillus melleus]
MDAAMAELSTILEDGQKSAEEEEIKSSISCSDDKSKAIGLDTDFAKKFAEKFCSGDSQSADLSSSDVGLSGYEDYRFHFQYDAGQNCSQSCGDVFSTMIDNCQGLDSHSVQPSASASLDSCGASFMYSFEQPNPTPSCDLDKSVDLPADVFTSGIYDKFCDSFQEGKQQTWVVNQNGDNPTKKRGLQRRTPPANANSYSNYRTTLQFDVTGSMSCSMSCADAFKSIAQSPCGRAGSQQNVMSKEASIDINCGTLSYVIRDKDEPEYATLEVGEQKCFPADKWGDFPKMPSKDDSSWDQYFLHNACGASMPHQKVSADHQLSSFYGDNGRQQYHFDVKWIPGCQLKDQTEQDLTDPLGSDSDAHCGTLFKNTYFDCMDGDAKNGGAGGWIDVGCVRYLFKPTNTRD